MIKAIAQPMRINDDWLLKVRLTVPPTVQSGSITFDGVPICSTSAGSLMDNSIRFSNERNFLIYTDYPHGTESINCVVSYGKEHDVAHMDIPRKSTIEVAKMNIPSKPTNLQAHISIREDILIEITNSHRAWVSLGENSKELLASDFVTEIQDKQKTMIIPIDVFWSKSKLYKGDELGLFELLSVDHSIKNIYCKKLISNLLKISDFPAKKTLIKSFTSPIGELITLGHNDG